MENNKKYYLVLGSILGLSLIISAGIASFTFYKIRSGETITTTGSTKTAVKSDKAKWIINITRPTTQSTIKNGYAKIDEDTKEVKNFLMQNALTEEQITISPVYMYDIYEQYQTTEKKYNLSQNIEVQSDDVSKIDLLAKNINSLVIDKGILISTSALEFYYSKLPETRVALLGDAVKDAKARAEELAKAGGKSVRVLKSASSGVVQVMSPNSVEVSDYGMYDTSKIDKEVMVTVKATFEIK